MVEKRRLSGEQRRESILRAVRRVFAEGGFRGTTTRALAEAAGVSEALLFKHFPSKEALYAAMQAEYARESDVDASRSASAAEPSTVALVRTVHAFYDRMIGTRARGTSGEDEILARLMFRSLTDDGEFARMFIRRVASQLVARLEACLDAAAEAGDIEASPASPRLAAWFTHHLGVTLLLHHLPHPTVIDYGVSRPLLVEQAVRFALRGIGLKEEAIRRCYNPEEGAGETR